MEAYSGRMLECPSPRCKNKKVCCNFLMEENCIKTQVICKACGTSGPLINLTFSDHALGWKEADDYIKALKDNAVNAAVEDWNALSRYVDGLNVSVVRGWNEHQLSEVIMQLLSTLQHKKGDKL